MPTSLETQVGRKAASHSRMPTTAPRGASSPGVVKSHRGAAATPRAPLSRRERKARGSGVEPSAPGAVPLLGVTIGNLWLVPGLFLLSIFPVCARAVFDAFVACLSAIGDCLCGNEDDERGRCAVARDRVLCRSHGKGGAAGTPGARSAAATATVDPPADAEPAASTQGTPGDAFRPQAIPLRGTTSSPGAVGPGASELSRQALASSAALRSPPFEKSKRAVRAGAAHHAARTPQAVIQTPRPERAPRVAGSGQRSAAQGSAPARVPRWCARTPAAPPAPPSTVLWPSEEWLDVMPLDDLRALAARHGVAEQGDEQHEAAPANDDNNALKTPQRELHQPPHATRAALSARLKRYAAKAADEDARQRAAAQELRRPGVCDYKARSDVGSQNAQLFELALSSDGTCLELRNAALQRARAAAAALEKARLQRHNFTVVPGIDEHFAAAPPAAVQIPLKAVCGFDLRLEGQWMATVRETREAPAREARGGAGPGAGVVMRPPGWATLIIETDAHCPASAEAASIGRELLVPESKQCCRCCCRRCACFAARPLLVTRFDMLDVGTARMWGSEVCEARRGDVLWQIPDWAMWLPACCYSRGLRTLVNVVLVFVTLFTIISSIVMLYNNVGLVRDVFDDILHKVRPLLEWLRGYLGSLMQRVEDAFEQMTEWFWEVWRPLSVLLLPLWQAARAAAAPVIRLGGAVWRSAAALCRACQCGQCSRCWAAVTKMFGPCRRCFASLRGMCGPCQRGCAACRRACAGMWRACSGLYEAARRLGPAFGRMWANCRRSFSSCRNFCASLRSIASAAWSLVDRAVSPMWRCWRRFSNKLQFSNLGRAQHAQQYLMRAVNGVKAGVLGVMRSSMVRWFIRAKRRAGDDNDAEASGDDTQAVSDGDDGGGGGSSGDDATPPVDAAALSHSSSPLLPRSDLAGDDDGSDGFDVDFDGAADLASTAPPDSRAGLRRRTARTRPPRLQKTVSAL